MQDAIAEAAKRAKLDPAKVHAEYLEREPSVAAQFAAAYAERRRDDDDGAADGTGGDVFARIAAERRGLLAQALGDVKRLAQAGSVQARCLECGGLGPSETAGPDARLLDLILARLGIGA
ncbi:MAG: hypothetical protein PGN08_03545 [Sphingomonas taxi]